jgi:hypothetical protein
MMNQGMRNENSTSSDDDINAAHSLCWTVLEVLVVFGLLMLFVFLIFCVAHLLWFKLKITD